MPRFAARLAALAIGLLVVPARAGEPLLPWPTEDWQTSTAEEQGMSSGVLAGVVEFVGTTRQDSLLIIRHGKIVTEAYYAPYRAGIPHDLRSVTKSIISTLTAIEIRNGFLDTVDHPVIDLFPEKAITNIDDNKRAMTVQTLLDMTSGIDWVEKNYTPNETVMKMYRAPDRTAFVLDQPMANPPGTHFYYNSGNPYVLSALITQSTGRSALDFAKEKLFGPLGISKLSWGKVDAQGVTDGEAGLYLMPRDMAKIGYLYLHDGMWDGKQIIPSSWAARARGGQIPATFGLHYANLWWSLPEKDAFMALGRHSQTIMVLPKLDIVAVMTGIMRDDEYYSVARLVDQIASAVKADGALPPDAVGPPLLAAAIRGAATERPTAVGDTPDLATVISGKSYRFSDNDLHVRTLSLQLAGADPSWDMTTNDGKPGDATEHFSGPIGLDGTYRKGPPNSYGIDAVKGRWISSNTFTLDRWVLGRSALQRWVVTFSGKIIDVGFENTDGFKTQIQGEEAN